jgi:hypothetical protein
MQLKLRFAKNRTQTAPYCPCGKRNNDGKFAPLKDFPKAGKCHSCERFFKPEVSYNVCQIAASPISYLDFKLVSDSVRGFEKSTFSKWYLKLLNPSAANILREYRVGYYRKWGDDVLFWQLDFNGKVRTGKIMAYQLNGERKKSGPAITWVHSELEMTNHNLEQCLFGEHLLFKRPLQKVAIVESEKTALIAAFFYPNVIWLATGGKGNMKIRPELKKVLKSRKVVLYPDAGEYDFWLQKSEGFGFDINEKIEKLFLLGKVIKGFDLADYFMDYQKSELVINQSIQ